jgi:cell division protein FtsI (penicillin-binding protein 3)
MSHRPTPTPEGISRGRLRGLALVAVGLFALTLVEGGMLPVRYGEALATARAKRDSATTVGAFRGGVYDRNGIPLAVSRPEIELRVDVRVLAREMVSGKENLETVLSYVARELGLESDEVARMRAELADPLGRAVAIQERLLHARRFEERQPLERSLRQLPAYLKLIERIPLPAGQRFKKLISKAYRGKVLTKKFRENGKRSPGFMCAFLTELRTARHYPERELAGHLIGFVNRDQKGVEGVERTMNNALTPRRVAVQGERDRRGHFLPDEEVPDSGEMMGADVFLTLDQPLQAHVQRVLAKQVRSQRAVGGSAVVLDARSGAILAMASVPTMDPLSSQQRVDRARRDRVASYGYDLGSTVKPFVIAKALEDRRIKPYQTMECDNGRIMIPGKRRPTWDHHKMKLCTITEIIAHSSNVGTVKIGRITGHKVVRQFFVKAGLVETPSIGIGRPPRGALPRVTRGFMSRTDGDTMMFGYALRGTLLSITTAYTAFANEGERIEPFLIDRVAGVVGERSLARGARRRVISPEVVAMVKPMLGAVVSSGEKDHPARIPGVRVGGKTGTSQKFIKPLGYQGHRKRFASFVGIAPLDDPRFVIGVMIDEPKDRYGAAAAGPVFRKVGHFALTRLAGMTLPELGDAPKASIAEWTGEPDEAAVSAAEDDELLERVRTALKRSAMVRGRLPDFSGLDVRSALAELGALDLLARIEGSGVVIEQTPPADTDLSEVHGQVVLHLGRL